MRKAWVYVGRVKTPTGWERELYASAEGEYSVTAGGEYIPLDAEASQWAAREHLEVLIKASGLSRRRFAEQRLARNESTLRRWTAGKVSIPQTVIRTLYALSVGLAAGEDALALEAALLAPPERRVKGAGQ